MVGVWFSASVSRTINQWTGIVRTRSWSSMNPRRLHVVGKFWTYEVGKFGPRLTSFENFPTSDFPSFSFFEIHFPTTCKPTNVLSIYDQMFHSNVEPLLFRPIFGFRHPWVGNDLWITMRFSTTGWSNCGKLQVAIRTNL